jgi:hypothetical protein
MAARYQHVTDTLRSQVASEVGELIWDSQTPGGSEVVVGAEQLAVLLQAVEDCIANHPGARRPGGDVLAAIAEIRAALPAAPESTGEANETKTETRRSPR